MFIGLVQNLLKAIAVIKSKKAMPYGRLVDRASHSHELELSSKILGCFE